MSLGAQGQPDITDEVLVRQFQSSRDISAYAELFARYRRRVYCSCRAFSGNSAAAEDATQETFLRAFENIYQFQSGNFCGWLMRIAKNVCIDMYRKQKPEFPTDDAVMEGKPADGQLDQQSDLHFAVQMLQHEMRLLSPEQCRCFELKIEGYSYEETALRTGLTVDAVKSHLQNGRRMLWSKMGPTLSQLR
jgi:RNA polymerase sigma-70 factor, ECF subfamily